MIIGGQNASTSPIARPITPRATSSAESFAPTLPGWANVAAVLRSGETSSAPTSPTPRASPTSGCPAKLRSRRWNSGALARTWPTMSRRW